MIGISWGHIPSAPGASVPGLYAEYTYNRVFAEYMHDYIRQILGPSHTVLIDCNKEHTSNQALTAKVSKALSAGCDLLVEVHHNYGYPCDYAEVMYFRGNRRTKALAQDIGNTIYCNTQGYGNTRAKLTALPDARYGHKWLIEKAPISAIILEAAFLNNTNAASYFKGPYAIKELAIHCATSLIDSYERNFKLT